MFTALGVSAVEPLNALITLATGPGQKQLATLRHPILNARGGYSESLHFACLCSNIRYALPQCRYYKPAAIDA